MELHIDGAHLVLPLGLLGVLPELPRGVVDLVEEAEVLRVAVGRVGASVAHRSQVARFARAGEERLLLLEQDEQGARAPPARGRRLGDDAARAFADAAPVLGAMAWPRRRLRRGALREVGEAG